MLQKMSRLIKAKFIQVSICFHLSQSPFCEGALLKALLCTNVPNDVTAALFLASFSQLPAVKKDTENGAAVTSLRTFVRSNDFM